MKTRMTRRQWAAALSLAGPAALSAAQIQPAQSPASPEEELAAARDRNRRMAEGIRGVTIPPAVEPAFRFEA
jgi:hypothetical protein